jgi:hypothetical protein
LFVLKVKKTKKKILVDASQRYMWQTKSLTITRQSTAYIVSKMCIHVVLAKPFWPPYSSTNQADGIKYYTIESCCCPVVAKTPWFLPPIEN